MKRTCLITIICFSTLLMSCGDSSTSNNKTTAQKAPVSASKNSKTKGNQKSVTLSNTTVVEKNIDGSKVYRTFCSSCHGMDGKMNASGAKDLTKSKMTHDQMVRIVKEGKNTMMSYQGVISEAKIQAVVKYVRSLKK